MRSSRLNGQVLQLQEAGEESLEVQLSGLSARNELVLEVSVPETPNASAGDQRRWGEIALLIRPAQTDSPGPLA